ncbi:hypothetical protein Afil01_12480 [Actinorhabdospora filicis]|uniref:Uncharacterized protein n=1 Tax=Actinorhabdospora filicis TaxID=1785913 RepID=A0A9W6SIZ5_9ACTN|nr:hypothetical protein [Actinorhabdospora filicis]GLZ76441.1 hypothetical protein Afil01_12480 [Actinorhabdospora filicis]
MARKGWEGPDDARGWDLVGGDPAPGDPPTIRTYATRYKEIADNTEHAGTIATMLKGDQYGKGGAGKTMEQISSRVAELPGWLGKLTTAFRSAGDAVDKYTGVLEQAQGDAQRALTMALEAEAEMKTAGGALGHARAALSFAAEVARDDKKDLATDRDYLAAKDAFEAAKRTVAGVEGKMNMARQIAADARALREGAVKTAVTALNTAAEVRVPDRGLGEKIVDWIKNNSWFKWVIGILSFGLAFFGAIGLAISLTLTAIDMGTVILEGVVTGHWDIAALVLGALAFVPGFVWVKAGKTIAGLPGIKQFLALPKVAAFNAAAAAKIGTLITKVTNFAKTLGNLALTGAKNLGSAIKGLITKGLDNVFQMKTVKVDVRPVSPVHSTTPAPAKPEVKPRPQSGDFDDIVWQRPDGSKARPQSHYPGATPIHIEPPNVGRAADDMDIDLPPSPGRAADDMDIDLPPSPGRAADDMDIDLPPSPGRAADDMDIDLPPSPGRAADDMDIDLPPSPGRAADDMDIDLPPSPGRAADDMDIDLPPAGRAADDLDAIPFNRKRRAEDDLETDLPKMAHSKLPGKLTVPKFPHYEPPPHVPGPSSVPPGTRVNFGDDIEAFKLPTKDGTVGYGFKHDAEWVGTPRFPGDRWMGDVNAWGHMDIRKVGRPVDNGPWTNHTKAPWANEEIFMFSAHGDLKTVAIPKNVDMPASTVTAKAEDMVPGTAYPNVEGIDIGGIKIHLADKWVVNVGTKAEPMFSEIKNFAYSADNMRVTGKADHFLDASQTAEVLMKNPEFLKIKEAGGSLVLNSCKTGEIYSGFADKLAEKLGMKVYAPDNISYIGTHIPMGAMDHAATVPGAWRTFETNKLAEITPKYFGEAFDAEKIIKTYEGPALKRAEEMYDIAAANARVGIPDELVSKFATEIRTMGVPLETALNDIAVVMRDQPKMPFGDVVKTVSNIHFMGGGGAKIYDTLFDLGRESRAAGMTVDHYLNGKVLDTLLSSWD